MSWLGNFNGNFFGGWWGALVEYASRAKRGFSYVVTKAQELFVTTRQAEKTVKTRGRQD